MAVHRCKGLAHLVGINDIGHHGKGCGTEFVSHLLKADQGATENGDPATRRHQLGSHLPAQAGGSAGYQSSFACQRVGWKGIVIHYFSPAQVVCIANNN